MSDLASGETIKYGAKTVLRLNLSESWDIQNLSAISVRVTDDNGVELVSDDATLYTATTLGAASSKFATSITLESTADDLLPGDTIAIGAPGEIIEAREVVSYDTDTHIALITPELKHAHAEDAPVVPLWAIYELDLSDTSVYPKGKSIWVRWNPDTSDGEVVNAYVVGTDKFVESDFWSEFEAIYPNEFSMMGSRDREKFLSVVKRRFSMDFADKGIDIDRLQDQAIIQDGLSLRARYILLEGTRSDDEKDFDRAVGEWIKWFEKICHLPMWQDTDQDEQQEEDEVVVASDFFEDRRYF